MTNTLVQASKHVAGAFKAAIDVRFNETLFSTCSHITCFSCCSAGFMFGNSDTENNIMSVPFGSGKQYWLMDGTVAASNKNVDSYQMIFLLFTNNTML